MIAIADHKGKRELFFLESETQKMINCEHVIVQRVVLLFFRLNLNKLTILNKRHQDCRIYVRNISGTFQETIVQGICQKKSQQRTRG